MLHVSCVCVCVHFLCSVGRANRGWLGEWRGPPLRLCGISHGDVESCLYMQRNRKGNGPAARRDPTVNGWDGVRGNIQFSQYLWNT